MAQECAVHENIIQEWANRFLHFVVLIKVKTIEVTK